MLKKELIEKLKDIKDDADINEAVLALDDFKPKEPDLTKITSEQIKTLSESNEAFKGFLTSHDDSVRSKAVDTFKKGKMQEEIKKAVEEVTNKELTPEQKEIAELKAWKEEQEKVNARNAMRYKISKVLTDKKLPQELIDYVVKETEEDSNKAVDFFDGFIGKMKEQLLKDNAPKPPVDNPTGGAGSSMKDAIALQLKSQGVE